MVSLSTDLKTLFENAMQLLARNEAGLALHLANQIISLAPNNPDSYNLLGVCAIALRDQTSAEQCWLHSITLHSETIEAHYNLALLYVDTQRDARAETFLERTLVLAPMHAAAYAQLAMLQTRTNRAVSGKHNYRRALEIDPSNVAIWNNLGLLLSSQKQDALAEDAYLHALTLAPDDAKAHSNLGVLLNHCKRDKEAEQSFHRALQLKPENSDAHANLGLLLAARGNYTEAERCLRQALRYDPASAENHANLADLLAATQHDQEAERYYRKALTQKPNSEVTLSNFGVFLAYRLRDAEAESCFRRALVLAPDSPVATLNLSMLLLAQGRFEDGWRYHESRYDPALPAPDAPLPSLPIAQWQGESLAGKSLLVWPEQGYGDLIQFCRYLSQIKAQGASYIALVCRSTLTALMRTLDGIDTVIGIAEIGNHDLGYDYWTFPMSLPFHCHTALTSIPAPIPYLHASAERLALWSKRMPRQSEKFRVGIVWQGNPMHANDDKRSLPNLATLDALWAFDTVQYFSLQICAGSDVARDLADNDQLIDLGSQIRDFADTAAILQQIDLLICVDTAVAHLAGALGRPCWVLLPNYRTDWRWMRDRLDSPWYPDMRLFRQAPQQDWSEVIRDVASSLRERINQP